MAYEKNQHQAKPLEPLDEKIIFELHRIASHYMRREHAGHTLQATALVNEAYLKLMSHPLQVNDKNHFLALAAKQMRHILVDHARQKSAQKRGGDQLNVSLNESVGVVSNHINELIYIDELLLELAKFDPRGAQIFEIRLFSALSNQEIADTLQLSLTTVERDIKATKAWFKTHLVR